MSTENGVQALQAQIEDLQAQIEVLQAAAEVRPTMIPIKDRSYSVSETPITVAQFQAFCADTEREMPLQPDPQNPQNPVTCVSWDDANAYVDWLNRDAGSGERYALPHEDMFEHFCGNHREASEDNAVYAQTKIQPVKTKAPNDYGLYDVLGCVWEWQSNEYNRSDPCDP